MDWEKKTEFTAESPEDLPRMLDEFLPDCGAETPTVERASMHQFIKTFSRIGGLTFPLKLRHISSLTPDFQITVESKIGVEVTRIAETNVERARALHAGGQIHGTLCLTSLYRTNLGKLTDEEIIRTVSQVSAPNAIAKTQDFWLNRFQTILEKKTVQYGKPHFGRGSSEDWLLVLDRLPYDVLPSAAKLAEIERLLNPYWVQDWFDRVYIQHFSFNYLIGCSIDGVDYICDNIAAPG